MSRGLITARIAETVSMGRLRFIAMAPGLGVRFYLAFVERCIGVNLIKYLCVQIDCWLLVGAVEAIAKDGCELPDVWLDQAAARTEWQRVETQAAFCDFSPAAWGTSKPAR